MEIVLSTLTVLFQTFLFASITGMIQKYKYTSRDYFLILVGIVIPGLVLYFIFERYSLFYFILAFFVFYYKRAKALGIISVLITVLILTISSFFGVIVYTYLINLHVNDYVSIVLYTLFFALCCYFLAFILVFVLNKFKLSWLHLNRLYLTLLILALAVGVYVFFYLMPKSVDTMNEFKTLGVIYFISFLIFALLIIVTTLTIEREMNYRRKKQELEDYYKYTLQIEKINNKMRKFRHDYINILLTMSEYLREDDLPGLKKYYHEHISPLKSDFESHSVKLNGVENLKVREIKGLITTKILQAQEKNIEISVEVADEITEIHMESINLSRALGIILDNAIEASYAIDNPMIQIAFIKTDTSVLIVIMNKAPKDMPKLHTLMQDGFSTKGKNRGIGLTTLKEIIDQTENAFLDTTIENHYFVQKLEIMNDEEQGSVNNENFDL
ncbi:quorum-sensing sensor histidine kinase AgrC [Staphylococcus lutrae]|uniref:ATP-binding protein n=1 Tax=Staphylococcus lutrae TaxID=155085 RepID=A0AAC9RR80_9STAP|nr:GHKL domain-containing protein [Staphylococcus lutrae]ARJ50216.1 ATP-binding protein [Staphylococcus lutrae]PNZ39328.1 GHKL domain-containing protein [Staphylococcus lutrae]